MNFSFYILGTPNGYNQYPLDNTGQEFMSFIQQNNAESQLTIKRSGQLVYYVYSRRLQDKTNKFLGFCLVFNGVYCENQKKLSDLFDSAFYDVQMKGELVKFEKGNAVYSINKFSEKALEIERIKTFFKTHIDSGFAGDFAAVSPKFKVGNGSIRISIKENNADIIAAMAEFDIVHVTNNEKSLSELERTQKLLTDLYAEKEILSKKYNKLLSQKKQYKVVLFLCFILIGCAIGLFTFNENLKSKDSTIINLQSNIADMNDTISSKQSEISDLHYNCQNLKNEMNGLNETIITRDNTIKEYKYEIQSLNETNNYLSSQINDLKDDFKMAKRSTSNNCAEKYEVYASSGTKAYCYYLSGGSYHEANCYYSDHDIVYVYLKRDGYGLTSDGYVRMKDLR